MSGTNLPIWRNSQGIDLLSSEDEGTSRSIRQRKYVLYDHMRWVRVEGDCSLFMPSVTKEDQGEYTCTYLEPEFKFVQSENVWLQGHITCHLLLIVGDLTPARANTEPRKVQEQLAMATTTRVTVAPLEVTTIVPETSTSVNNLAQANMEVTISERVTNITKIGEETDADRSEIVEMTISEDFDETAGITTEQYRALEKRESEWKAFGFDSSKVEIEDQWAGRNLWYQQVTHSVRSVRKLKCPCVVKIPTPSTWPSVLETIPEPLSYKCQSYVLSWLLYHQKSGDDVWRTVSVHLFRPRGECSWLRGLKYVNLQDQQETTIPDAIQVRAVATQDCFCSNDTYKGPGVFLGISECEIYMMNLGKTKDWSKLHEVVFQIPNENNRVLMVRDQEMPGNATIGNFKDIWWVCGDKAYLFLPYGWTGCCYMATLRLPYEVVAIQMGNTSDEVPDETISRRRIKRAMAQFHDLESYHWRISLGEKWGIGLFPWYGVTFLADHIDNITYTLQGFGNETIKGFQYLSNAQRSHRLTLLKHDMALDYLLAKQGGLCMALNLTGDACYTLIPDNKDNMTSVIDALKHIRDAFGPSEGAGWSANAWLLEKFGPMGAMLVQIMIAVVLSLSVMFCFCTMLLTCAKAMLLRWIGVVLPSDQIQMPLLNRTDTDDEEETALGGILVEKYPF